MRILSNRRVSFALGPRLLHRACHFQNAKGMHDSLRQLYTLLASGAISPRRAAVLGYLTSLLLRTLPAVYNPLPLAGTLMCAAQLAERDKAKSRPLARPNPPLRLPRKRCQPRKPRLLSKPRLHRSSPRQRRHQVLRLPIKLSRKLPRRPLRCLPIIPHHQPTPLTPAITSTAAQAVPYPAPAPNSLRKSLSP
jgi:hypothetical protein